MHQKKLPLLALLLLLPLFLHAAPSPPNIVLVRADDMHNDLSTPQPDRLKTVVAHWHAWADRIGAQPWPTKRNK